MKRSLIRELPGRIGTIVKVQGFVDTIRQQKRHVFLVVRDRTGSVQVLYSRDSESGELGVAMSRLTVESTVSIIGTVLEEPRVKHAGIEIHIQHLEVTSQAGTPLPIAPDSLLDKQIDWRQISLRYPRNALIFRIQTTMEHAMREFWRQNEFIEIHSPKLMGSASESGAELFTVPYFKEHTAYLAQSPQFYKQMAMAAGFERVFEIGPVFRANPSFTSRHDTEFTSVDMEVSWIESYHDVMALEEEWLCHVLSVVSSVHGTEIEEVFGAPVNVPVRPFPQMTLKDARRILAEMGHQIGHKADLDPAGERLLSAYVLEKCGHEFVFVTEYPAEVRAFYHMRPEGAPDVTLSFDLLWKGLEITTGAQREHRVEVLVQQAIERGFKVDGLWHYISFFRYGCPPHGGLGVGLTRLLMVLLNVGNVREVTYLYRGPNRLTP